MKRTRTEQARAALVEALAIYPNQTHAARALGVVPSYISMLTRGERVPSFPVAYRISKLTGLPLETVALATIPEVA